jgi:16S rRNA processing protein RimM
VDDLFLIAEVKAVIGSNGFVLIDSYSDFSERFFHLKNVSIEFFGTYKEFFVEEVKRNGKSFAVKFKGINSEEDAKMFLRKKIFVEKKNSVILSDNTFFIHDVIGSEVFRNSKLIGYVKDVLILPANDVYLIKDLDGEEILMPAVKDYVMEFNPNIKKLILVPDCDLLYDDEN